MKKIGDPSQNDLVTVSQNIGLAVFQIHLSVGGPKLEKIEDHIFVSCSLWFDIFELKCKNGLL